MERPPDIQKELVTNIGIILVFGTFVDWEKINYWISCTAMHEGKLISSVAFVHNYGNVFQVNMVSIPTEYRRHKIYTTMCDIADELGSKLPIPPKVASSWLLTNDAVEFWKNRNK